MTTYKDAGVDIDKANSLMGSIREIAEGTQDSLIQSPVGSFCAGFELPGRFTHPVIVTSTDGVGTKLKLGRKLNKLDNIGQDLVAMCVNDIVVCGADPIAFLDYYATNKLDPKLAEVVIASIADGCVMSGCALVGGETAEMPGTYANDEDIELAGFVIGAVNQHERINGWNIKQGNLLIGIPSKGVHSNGYSLINKLIDDGELSHLERGTRVWFQRSGPLTLAQALMYPTRIYSGLLRSLRWDLVNRGFDILGAAHITGGGLVDNVPRMIPSFLYSCLGVDIYWDKIQMPLIFETIQQAAGIDRDEMFKTFNCGIGMVVCVEGSAAAATLDSLDSMGERGEIIGRIV